MEVLVSLYEEKRFPQLEEFVNSFQSRNYVYYASELFDDGSYEREEEILRAIERAMIVCATLNITVNDHFKTVYKSVGDDVYIDWKLSPLACSLTLLNGDVKMSKVADFQFLLVKKYFDGKF